MNFLNTIIEFFNPNNTPVVPEFVAPPESKLWQRTVQKHEEVDTSDTQPLFVEFVEKDTPIDERLIQRLSTPTTLPADNANFLGKFSELWLPLSAFWANKLGLSANLTQAGNEIAGRAFGGQMRLYALPLEWRLLFIKEFSELVQFIVVYRKYKDHIILSAFSEAYLVLIFLYVLAEDSKKTDIRTQGLVSYLKECLGL